MHHVIDGLPEFRILPVQVWVSAKAEESKIGLTRLLLEEGVAVPLLRSFVKCPRGTTGDQHGRPIYVQAF